MTLYRKEFLGEALGTFILVLFGCGAVATSILFNAYQGILQIALAWGFGVTLAIYLTRHLSCAHLNPAVSIAMLISKRMNPKKLPSYILAQFSGAFVAGLILYLLFASNIANYENTHEIIRGAPESALTAQMFGEYYMLPGKVQLVNMPLAMTAEFFGTFLLLVMIFALTEGCNIGRPNEPIAPLFIGMTVASVICLIAPLTQAGINPARDFSPRLVSWIFGWGKAAFPDKYGGFFLVYILSPVVGGIVASYFFMYIIEPAMKKKSSDCNCN